jgi:hypothetical protein
MVNADGVGTVVQSHQQENMDTQISKVNHGQKD